MADDDGFSYLDYERAIDILWERMKEIVLTRQQTWRNLLCCVAWNIRRNYSSLMKRLYKRQLESRGNIQLGLVNEQFGIKEMFDLVDHYLKRLREARK